MSSPFVAEIRMWGCGFAPNGWAFCDGQLLPISQNTALFSLLGTYYGGDGKSNFALPNLQGNVPMHWGQSQAGSTYDLGEASGDGCGDADPSRGAAAHPRSPGRCTPGRPEQPEPAELARTLDSRIHLQATCGRGDAPGAVAGGGAGRQVAGSRTTT